MEPRAIGLEAESAAALATVRAAIGEGDRVYLFRIYADVKRRRYRVYVPGAEQIDDVTRAIGVLCDLRVTDSGEILGGRDERGPDVRQILGELLTAACARPVKVIS